jgi:outer membrane protein assembly factor BamA
MKIGLRASALLLAAGTAALAQGPIESRQQEIELRRDQKAAAAAPDTPNKAERRLIRVKETRLLERLSAGYAGVRVKIGGMATGSGFALGPEYFREDLATGHLNLIAGVGASTRHWVNMYAGLSAPQMSNGRFDWAIGAIRHDYNSLAYYGQGPDSEKIQRTNYRLEDTTIDSRFGVRPVRWATVGISAGYLWANAGPGQDERYASIEEVYPPRAVPGYLNNTNFYRTGAHGIIDYRDDPRGARSGGLYSVRWDRYRDRVHNLHDFQRLDVNLQQFIPCFNERRVIALRAHTQLRYNSPGKVVPFYLNAFLGGSNDLRGYRPYRFTDENLFNMTGEYRWEVFSGLDMAIFADAGKVFPKPGMLNFSNLESSVGFGFRGNVRNATFIRIDVGFSHEGFQVWVKFNDVFSQRPVGSSSPTHVF